MANQLSFGDTFGEWKEKINTLVDEFNQSEVVLDGDFDYKASATVGLNVTIVGGRVRDGSEITEIPTTVLTILPNKTNVIVINKVKAVPGTIGFYDIALLPAKGVIPLGYLVTNGTTVTSYVDLRTPYNTGAGGTGSTGGMVMIDANIVESVSIAVGQNAISVDPIVAPGVEVTVEEGSIWVIL